MEKDEAWKSLFNVCENGNGRYWLVTRKGEHFSYNMVLYKTKAGATSGAKAAHKKSVREFETAFLKQ